MLPGTCGVPLPARGRDGHDASRRLPLAHASRQETQATIVSRAIPRDSHVNDELVRFVRRHESMLVDAAKLTLKVLVLLAFVGARPTGVNMLRPCSHVCLVLKARLNHPLSKLQIVAVVSTRVRIVILRAECCYCGFRRFDDHYRFSLGAFQQA